MTSWYCDTDKLWYDKITKEHKLKIKKLTWKYSYYYVSKHNSARTKRHTHTAHAYSTHVRTDKIEEALERFSWFGKKI